MKQYAFIFIMTCLAGCYSKVVPERTGLEGELLPSFNIQLTDSTTFLNTANIPSGKPLAVLFFSPQCPYCKAQVDEIVKSMNKLKDIHFYLLTNFPVADMKSFYKRYKLAQYPNMTVARDTASFAINYFGITGVPYTAIYGKDKRLHNAFTGHMDVRQIKSIAEN